MENSEVPETREFSSLNDPEKVEAILGVTLESVSKSLAIDLSGINYTNLQDEERKSVDEIFSSEDVETVEVGEDTRYRLRGEARGELAKRVDVQSVHKTIADKMWGDLGFDS